MRPGDDIEETQRSAELIEDLLGSPDLRRRFRDDPGVVLREHGLGQLAEGLGEGRRALMTLELRESRSSLAGVMVAAAVEGIELGHMLGQAAPALGRQVGQAVEHLGDKPHHRPVAHGVASHRIAPPAPPAPPAGPADQRDGAPAVARAARNGPAPGAYGGAPAHGGPEHVPLRHDLAAHAGLLEPAAVLRYPGDGASPQSLAAWMGAHAQRAGLPPELPVMAALTESGLHNLNYGDRDSVGFFQMRLGIWNTGAYAGYPERPELQIQWFIDHALAVRQAEPQLAESPSAWGEWVANVEQPAAEYRGRYQLQLGAAQELLHAGGSHGAVPLGSSPEPVPTPVAHLPIGQAAVKVAMEYLTTSHQGGPGLDGSTLVQYAFAREGLRLPGVATELFDVGAPVARHGLQPGDAVFFAEGNGGRRVGLYIGHDRYVAIPREGGHATVAELSAGGEYLGARRYTPRSVADPGRFARSLPTIKG